MQQIYTFLVEAGVVVQAIDTVIPSRHETRKVKMRGILLGPLKCENVNHRNREPLGFLSDSAMPKNVSASRTVSRASA